MKKITFAATLILGLLINQVFAQNSKTPSANMPEYIVITANNTSLLGGIGLIIDTKNSMYADKLATLEKELDSKKEGKGVRNLTDLLCAMSELGYEYVNAFAATSSEVVAGMEKNRSNIVFRKKK